MLRILTLVTVVLLSGCGSSLEGVYTSERHEDRKITITDKTITAENNRSAMTIDYEISSEKEDGSKILLFKMERYGKTQKKKFTVTQLENKQINFKRGPLQGTWNKI